MLNEYEMTSEFDEEETDYVSPEVIEKSRNLVIKLLKGKRSQAWQYFGFLEEGEKSNNAGNCVDDVHVYCKLCFENSSGRKIHRYKKTVSTGNWNAHLKEVHNIEDGPKCLPKSVKEFFTSTSRPQGSSTSTSKKEELGNAMVSWFCRDLVPFNEAAKPGLKDFFLKQGFVKKEDEIPHPTALSRSALNRVYNICLEVLKSKITWDNPSTVAITMDAWTDSYRHLPYITFTMHWVSPQMKVMSCTLQTCYLPHPHTAEHIVAKLKAVINSFDLNMKTIILVTDGGSNMIKAAKDAKLDRIGCVAHGLHNLVLTDCVSKLHEVQTVVVKARSVVKTLTLKTQEIEEERQAIKQEEINAILDSCENLEEVLEADNRFHQGDESVESDHAYHLTYPSNSQLSGLHKDMPTRWNSTLEMLNSLISNKDLVIRCLELQRKYDVIPSNEDWEAMEDIVLCLNDIKLATEILSGSLYPTANLALLFRAEIKEKLKYDVEDTSMKADLKQALLNNLDRRFPINELHVCATLLDPTLSNLRGATDYLANKGITVTDFLVNMVKRFYIKTQVEKVQNSALQSTSYSRPTSASVSKTGLKGIKKLRLELAAKHASANERDPITAEIEKYLHCKQNVEDPLEWWEKNSCTFPILCQLVRCIYAIPITSAASERAFSSAGLLLTAKRSSLAVSKAHKVLFIHDNFNLLEKVANTDK